MNAVDFIRTVTAGSFGFLMALTAFVIYHHAVAVYKGRARLLPLHVILVGTSYLGACIYVALDLYSRIGRTLTWRTPLAVFILVIGVPALLMILEHVRRLEKGEPDA